jgi:hypothetical protein
MKTHRNLMLAGILLSFVVALTCFAAYNHMGTDAIDAKNFRDVYPQAAGTKLDSCALCHKGAPAVGNTPAQGSCQFCHVQTNYGAIPAQFAGTLNPYGQAYKDKGRSAAAITAIQDLDSDGDGYTNKVEITAIRYPGDKSDDPTKVPAPFKVFTRTDIEAMPQHAQFLLLNASKSTDIYAEYSGVTMESLLKRLVLPSAKDVVVQSPDGFLQTHPFDHDPTPNANYFVKGTYPPGTYFYNAIADITLNPSTGWCDYSAPSTAGRNNGDPTFNKGGLKLILAIKRDGQYLQAGVFNKTTKKLDGEGPFRVVPPQKNPGPPDQRSTASDPAKPWPYDANNMDHNAGFSSRSVTIMKVEPLPDGTTDIDLLDAGWDYIDQQKVVVYGAIDPTETIKDQLTKLIADIKALPRKDFQMPLEKVDLEWKLEMARWLAAIGLRDWSYKELEQVMLKMDGCVKSGHPDRSDWLKNCDAQANLYWAVNDVMVLLKIRN